MPQLYFLGLKGLLLVTLARSFAMNDAFQKHWIFFSALYASGVGALSWVFVLSMRPEIPNEVWKFWLLRTFLAAALFFKILERFSEGIMFWLVFSVGVLGLMWF